MSKILELKDVRKSFMQAGAEIKVLDGVDLSISRGELVALVGPSGSGKTTLLQIAGLLDKADSGKIFIKGEELASASDNKRTLARRENIGFVYQYHNLLPEFNAFENVSIPQIINGKSKEEANELSKKLLDKMGLSDRQTHRPGQLSGGQNQRVAIARALANDPVLILADEPTGNLDHNTSDQVFDVMRDVIKKTGCAALIATHNQELVDKMDRVLRIQDGVVS